MDFVVVTYESCEGCIIRKAEWTEIYGFKLWSGEIIDNILSLQSIFNIAQSKIILPIGSINIETKALIFWTQKSLKILMLMIRKRRKTMKKSSANENILDYINNVISNSL